MSISHLLLEGKIDDIYTKYYAQLIPERETFNQIISIDPTYNPDKDKMGQYGQWLLGLYKKGEDVLSEAKEFKDQLDIFNKTKNKLPVDRKDIFKLHSLKDIIDLNAEFEEKTSKSDLQLSAEQHPGARFISKSGDWEVYCPETYEASKFLRGDDAVWCTGRTNDDSYYRSYTRDGGKLFIFINTKGGEHKDSEGRTTDGKYQVSIRNGRVNEFRDARNNSANFMEFIADNGLYKALGQTEIAETKDYQAVKEVMNTGGKITYSNLMAIKYDSSNYDTSGGKMLKALKTFIKVIIVNDGLKMIIPECFKDMNAEKIILPDSVQLLGENCFTNCTKIKSIKLPNKITTIPRGCFSGCSSLEEVIFGTNIVEIKPTAFAETSDTLKLKTPHHKITIAKSELEWFKKHMEWEEEKREESLEEDLSKDVPEWIKPWLKGYKSVSGRGNIRNGAGYEQSLLKTLSDNDIDVNKMKIISKRVPKDKNDPIFDDENKILFFYIPKENLGMYRSNKNWVNVSEYSDVLFVKNAGEAMNNPTQGYYASDAISRRTNLQLIKMATKFAYIDKKDKTNFNDELRLNRANSRKDMVVRDATRGSHHVAKWTAVPKDEYRDSHSVQEFDTKDRALSWWKENDRVFWARPERVQDVYNKPTASSWKWVGPDKGGRYWGDTYDSSGFSTTVARKQLRTKLNDYQRRNYQTSIDSLRNRLEKCRKGLVDLFNSSLSDVTSNEINTFERILQQYTQCNQNYTKFISRLDYIEQMDTKEEQEKEFEDLFSLGSTAFGITYSGLKSDISKLESKLAEVETTYIESLNNPKSTKEALSVLKKIR